MNREVETLKALKSRIVRVNGKEYRLKQGVDAPPMSDKDASSLAKAGLIEKPTSPPKAVAVKLKEEKDNDATSAD